MTVLNVTPKTTEQNLIARSSKSEAEVTNHKRLRSSHCTVKATYRHETSRGLSATAELVVLQKSYSRLRLVFADLPLSLILS